MHNSGKDGFSSLNVVERTSAPVQEPVHQCSAVTDHPVSKGSWREMLVLQYCKHLNMKRAPVTRQPPRSPPPSDLQRSAGCTTSHFGLRRVIALHTAHCTHCALCKLQTAHHALQSAHTVHVQHIAFFCCKVESLADMSCCTFSRDISPAKILNPPCATNHQPMNQIVNDRPTHRPTA